MADYVFDPVAQIANAQHDSDCPRSSEVPKLMNQERLAGNFEQGLRGVFDRPPEARTQSPGQDADGRSFHVRRFESLEERQWANAS
jgi:hypothetical protein